MIGLGIVAAIAMLTKYYSAAMLPGIALYLLIFKEGRQTLRTFGPYLALLLFTLIMGWHVWYVLDRYVGTISHVADYVGDDFSMRWSGLRFLAAQMLYLTPLFLVYFVLRWFDRGQTADKAEQRARFDGSNGKSFIIWMFLFPLIGTAVVAFAAGIGVSQSVGGADRRLTLPGSSCYFFGEFPRSPDNSSGSLDQQQYGLSA